MNRHGERMHHNNFINPHKRITMWFFQPGNGPLTRRIFVTFSIHYWIESSLSTSTTHGVASKCQKQTFVSHQLFDGDHIEGRN